MIKINVITNSIGGVIVPEGIVLNITPHIVTRKELVDDVVTVKYDVGFDSTIFKTQSDFKSAVNVSPYLLAEMVEFPISYYAKDVPFESLNPTKLQEIYQGIIERGNGEYIGVGLGNTQVIKA